jgi:DNA replication initiation complex subunit (GINS family)
MQTSRRLSKLPEDFYPRFKRLLKALEGESRTEHAKMTELQKAIQLSTDILTCRLNKILILTSVTDKSEAVLQNLTPEERTLYEALYGEVEKWRSASWPQKEDK